MLEVHATIAGSVWQVAVAEGDQVSEGDIIVVLESMKMEFPVVATVSGVVASVFAREGTTIQEGDVLAVLHS